MWVYLKINDFLVIPLCHSKNITLFFDIMADSNPFTLNFCVIT